MWYKKDIEPRLDVFALFVELLVGVIPVSVSRLVGFEPIVERGFHYQSDEEYDTCNTGQDEEE